MDDFSKAVPGQKLWSLKYGEVEFKGILIGVYPIMCDIGKCHERWTMDGKCHTEEVTQDLYWSRPEIIAPPMPPRMVEKEFVFWVNVYPGGKLAWWHEDLDADLCAGPDRLGPAERVVIKRMVPVEE